MSWNNNGNNGSRDPWGGKDGPPDIDEALKKYVFTDTLHTKVVKNVHGDSSGVRGAAWLS